MKQFMFKFQGSFDNAFIGLALSLPEVLDDYVLMALWLFLSFRIEICETSLVI